MVVAGLGDPRRTPVRLARPGGRETVEEARFGACAAVDGALQGQGCDDKGIVTPGLTDAGLGHERKSSTRTRAVRGMRHLRDPRPTAPRRPRANPAHAHELGRTQQRPHSRSWAGVGDRWGARSSRTYSWMPRRRAERALWREALSRRSA